MTTPAATRDLDGDWVLVGTVDRDGLPAVGLLRWTGTPDDPEPKLEVLTWQPLTITETGQLQRLLAVGIQHATGQTAGQAAGALELDVDLRAALLLVTAYALHRATPGSELRLAARRLRAAVGAQPDHDDQRER